MCPRAIETEELAVLQTISALSSWPVPRVAHLVVPQGGTRTPDHPSRKALRMLYNYPLFPRQSPRARGLDSSPALCPSRHLLSHQTPTLSGEVGTVRPKRCSQVPLTFSRGTPGSPSSSACCDAHPRPHSICPGASTPDHQPLPDPLKQPRPEAPGPTSLKATPPYRFQTSQHWFPETVASVTLKGSQSGERHGRSHAVERSLWPRREVLKACNKVAIEKSRHTRKGWSVVPSGGVSDW